MPSLQSRLFNFSVKNRHWLQFRLKPEVWDMHTSVPRFREQCEAGAARFGGLAPGTTTTPAPISELPAGLAAEWIHPVGMEVMQSPGFIFYVHGGGYVSGSCADHRGLVSKLVQGTGKALLLYEYRLAPEHPYPAALEDTVVAYRWLLAQGITADRVVLAGESAGGGLGLAALLALRDQGLPLPAAAVVLSPWTDLKLTGESHRTRAKVAVDTPGMSAVCSKHYYGDHDPGDPYISPLYGDLHGLPRLRIYVGDHEMLRDDSTRFAAKAQAAGSDVQVTVGEGMIHCYPLLAPMFPEATAAMAEICEFIRRQLDPAQSVPAARTPEPALR